MFGLTLEVRVGPECISVDTIKVTAAVNRPANPEHPRVNRAVFSRPARRAPPPAAIVTQMAELNRKLEAGFRACGVPHGAGVLLAVSGGADSVALLRASADVAPAIGLRLHVGHLDHALRDDSASDAEFVAELAAKLHIPATIERRDIAAQARESRAGIEETARHARYAFLERAALAAGCGFVATAHTADDQAETILHHVLRGTGLSGLAGMKPVRPLGQQLRLIRPLLAVSRCEIVDYLRALNQEWRSDDTNCDRTLTRNRLRDELLPLLERDYNPRVRDALLKLGRQAADVQAFVEAEAARLLGAALLDCSAEAARIDVRSLRERDRHVVRECFSLLWRQAGWPRQKMRFEDWDRLADLVESEGSLALPGGIDAARRGDLLAIRRH